MSVSALVLAALLGAVSPPVTSGVTPSDTITLADALSLAAAGPLVEVAEAEVALAEADEWQARLLPNPEISYQGYARAIGTPDAINGQQHQVDLGGPLLLAGQRRARMRAARLDTAAVRGQTCFVRTEIQRQVALRWVELLAVQETVEILSRGRDALQEAEELTQTRASRGGQTKYEAERVSAELRALEIELQTAKVDLRDASRRLAIAIGRPKWAPRASGSLEGVARERGAMDIETGYEQIPAVDLARREERAAAAGVVVARRERWPVPSIYGGVYATTDGGSASVSFGVALPIPVFDRGQARVARARADSRRARLRTVAVERVAQAEHERAAEIVRARRQAVRQWDEQLEDTMPRLRIMAREAYVGGVSSVLELIDAERTHLQAHLRGLGLARDLAVAVIELDAARGSLGDPCG